MIHVSCNLVMFCFQNNPKARIYLPAEVFQRDQSNERVKFIHFRSAKLFPVIAGKPVAGTKLHFWGEFH